MRMEEGHVAAKPLFWTRTKDNVHWMFSFLPDETWAITRDGRDIAFGNCDSASIRRGVEKFRSLTTAAIGSEANLTATIAARVEHIERDKPATAKPTKRPRKVTPRVAGRMLAYSFSRSASQR